LEESQIRIGYSKFDHGAHIDLSHIYIIMKLYYEALMKGVNRVKESVIKKMENSESKAEVYTASNYRLAEVRRGIEEAKKGLHKVASVYIMYTQFVYWGNQICLQYQLWCQQCQL